MNGFLQDGDGDKSSMRLVLWYVFLLVGAVWAWCSVGGEGGPKMANIPDSVVELLVALLIGKVGQSTLAEGGGLGAILGAIRKTEQQGAHNAG